MKNKRHIVSKFLVSLYLLLAPLAASAQKLQVSTNAVGLACLGTFNAQIDYALSQHWSIGAAGKYNPFSYDGGVADSGVQLRQRSLSAVARYWPWHIYSGWWLCGKVQWQEYNMGGLLSEQTEEGQRYGAGITAGYTHMLSEHFNIEFGLGVWGGMKNYTVYACPTCGTKKDGGVKSFVMPNDVIIALSYVF